MVRANSSTGTCRCTLQTKTLQLRCTKSLVCATASLDTLTSVAGQKTLNFIYLSGKVYLRDVNRFNQESITDCKVESIVFINFKWILKELLCSKTSLSNGEVPGNIV